MLTAPGGVNELAEERGLRRALDQALGVPLDTHNEISIDCLKTLDRSVACVSRHLKPVTNACDCLMVNEFTLVRRRIRMRLRVLQGSSLTQCVTTDAG